LLFRNTTTAVREALKRAGAAQEAAQNAIQDATQQIADARNDLESANDGLRVAEEAAAKSNESLTKLDTDMKNVSVQYLEISEHARIAYEAADKALHQAVLGKTANEQLKASFDKAKELLSSRHKGNELPQARAEALRKRATQLLHKTQRHRADIYQLSANMDASDVRLGQYNRSVDELHLRID
uniref:I/LWEQ domain-containing protein n=1 Tax=Gongylonema pulchrum TaxID=637853 RepID=A0A183EZS1_9BILA